MKVEILRSRDPQCDCFVRQMPGARLCHTLAWVQMLEGCFGHPGHYLVARENANVRGVLPLTQVRSRLFGNRMVSQAFSDYGGPLADSAVARDALYERAVEIATELRCESVEFRNVEPLPFEGLATRSDKVSMQLPLPQDPEELWRQLEKNVRNQIRKGLKCGIVATSGGLELLDEFYRVWTVRMGQLGTPCYPRKFFHSLFSTFPDDCRIFVVRLDERTVGGVFAYSFNGFVELRWGAALVEHKSLCPYHPLYWSAMAYYCAAGARCFDFGRSTVDGPHYRFKKQWVTEQMTLHYQYWVRPGHDLSIVSPDNPKFRRKAELWKRMPLWATRLLGPLISRSLA